jgi:hypothetical protein
MQINVTKELKRVVVGVGLVIFAFSVAAVFNNSCSKCNPGTISLLGFLLLILTLVSTFGGIICIATAIFPFLEKD